MSRVFGPAKARATVKTTITAKAKNPGHVIIMCSLVLLCMFCVFLRIFVRFCMVLHVFACFWWFLCSRGDLGRSWGTLGHSRVDLGRSWDALGRSWGALGSSWGAPGRSWGALGRSWGALGAMLALSCKKTSKQSKRIRKFGFNLGGKMEPKSLKIDVKSQYVFRHLFFTIFFNFSLILEVEFRWFFDGFLDLKRKRRFCKN